MNPRNNNPNQKNKNHHHHHNKNVNNNNHHHHHNNNKNNKKNKNQNGEGKFRFELDRCSKHKDFAGAIALYESSSSRNVNLNSHHFNALLYLCSISVTDPAKKDSAIDYSFRIFDRMVSSNITPNEATITALARLAAAKGDGYKAFELVKEMGKYGVTPKLRSYDPVLFYFCGVLEADKAYEVEAHLNSTGLSVEEQHVSALLKVSAETGRADKVYEYLHKLRSTVRCVSESTVEVIENWFRNPVAFEAGSVDCKVGLIKEVMSKNGGGWHGQGWMGNGKWVVCKTNVEPNGRCCSCGEQLACIDIDKEETEKFAQSIAALALEREAKGNFRLFMDWMGKHANYEAIVDGANIALYGQNFADGGFSFSQLDAVVKELYRTSRQKWPLVILHNKRVRALMENPVSRKLLEEWEARGVLYTTPNGSNDDWYWLYAAIKLKCLLVTNDEMRDHIFELVGSKFILKWKERHQVRYTFVREHLKLRMPPPYSVVIQESEEGRWHVPLAGESDDDSSRTWLCIARSSTHGQLDKAAVNMENSKIGKPLDCNNNVSIACNSDINGAKASHGSPNSSQNIDNKTTKVSGKRKSRS